jgi:hypothetical protein
VKYLKLNITISQNLFIIHIIIISNMITENVTILDILRGASMQVSMWLWEMRMITQFGLNWGYKGPWDRF